MAYNFFPKSKDEIMSKLESWKEEQKVEVIRIFDLLKKDMEQPINIDVGIKTLINVSRQLQGQYTIEGIRSKANLRNIKIKFGNGSSGNRGANNRGNLFEKQFKDGLDDWWEGKEITDKAIKDAIDDLDKTYKLKKCRKFKAEVLGGENTKRPLAFQGNNIVLTNPKGKGNDIGKSITDITVTTCKEDIYLSLKLGGTTTFFNSGIKTVLSTQEIKTGIIKNTKGLALLKLFGIDPMLFCDVFNGKLKKAIPPQKGKFNKAAITKLLESGIGYNYHIIHRFPSKIISKKMDKSAMLKAANIIGGVKVYYGGKTGTGKRVDIEFQSSTYKFKLNMRDTQGGDGYPTRLMCDFTYA